MIDQPVTNDGAFVGRRIRLVCSQPPSGPKEIDGSQTYLCMAGKADY